MYRVYKIMRYENQKAVYIFCKSLFSKYRPDSARHDFEIEIFIFFFFFTWFIYITFLYI